MEDWIEARKRLTQMGYSDLVPQEMLTVLDGLVQPVLDRDNAASKRYQMERWSTDSMRPSARFTQRLTTMVIEELRLMVQKESQSAERNQEAEQTSSWTRTPEINAAAAAPSAGSRVVECSRPDVPRKGATAHEALVQADKDMKAQLLEFKKARKGALQVLSGPGLLQRR